MVAAARLRRAEQRIAAMRPYAQAIRKLTRQAAEAAGGIEKRVQLLEKREPERKLGLLLVTGDRGLAGAFNTQIIREGLRLKREFEGESATFSVVGRRLTRVDGEEKVTGRPFHSSTVNLWRADRVRPWSQMPGRQAVAASTSSRLALGRAVSFLPCCSTRSTGRPARSTSQLPPRRNSGRVPPSKSGISNGAPEP